MVKTAMKIIQPRRIRLDAATACQLKCPSCPTASGETGKKLGVGFLKFDDFKHVIDQNPWISHIELSNWGEVFLNKDLAKIFKYAYQQNVILTMANGVNLNTVHKDVLEAVVKYRVRRISCSIDGASQETYSIYRVKGNFDQVIENIKAINHWKSHYRSTYPRLRWQFVAFGHNEHEIGKARQMAKELGMEFFLKLSWGDFYNSEFSPIKDADLIRKETGLGVASRAEYREKLGKGYHVQKNCCGLMWRSPQINYDGRVLGCCVNYWDDYGNAFKDGLDQCLNGDKMNAARDVLMGKIEGRPDIPCFKCKVYAEMKQNNDWIKPEDIREEYYSSRSYIMFENKILGEERTRRLADSLYQIKCRLKGLRSGMQTPEVKPIGNRLKSNIYPLSIPLEPDLEKGWKPYPLFKGFTKRIPYLSCHASVLAPGHSPHPPHTHREEEVLIVLSGEADLTLPALKDQTGTDKLRLTTGQFVYYPTGFLHTIQTFSETPLNYLMFKWHAGVLQNHEQLGFKQWTAFEASHNREIKSGFTPRLLFQGPTKYLKKLHCHASTLSPGAGYKPHKDPYEVAIIVLEGEVETLGKRVGPHNVIFYAAGEPHGITNPGQVMAKYLVFEFHGGR